MQHTYKHANTNVSPVVHAMPNTANVILVQPPVGRVIAQIFPEQQEPEHELRLLPGTHRGHAAMIVHKLLGQ